MSRLLAAGLGAAVFAVAPQARADFSWGSDSQLDKLYFPVGLNLGSAGHQESTRAAVIGVEASLVRLFTRDTRMRFLWVGGYADALYDGKNEAIRFSLGPELGVSILGLDGGIVMQSGHDTGYTVRALLTMSLLSGYYRWIRFPGQQRDAPVNEVGVLLKLPIPLS